MLYILLCGVPPFWAGNLFFYLTVSCYLYPDLIIITIRIWIMISESENGIFKAILEGPIDLSSDPWPNISDGAKDLVKKMLSKDPQKRLTAFQVLSKYDGLVGRNCSKVNYVDHISYVLFSFFFLLIIKSISL